MHNIHIYLYLNHFLSLLTNVWWCNLCFTASTLRYSICTLNKYMCVVPTYVYYYLLYMVTIWLWLFCALCSIKDNISLQFSCCCLVMCERTPKKRFSSVQLVFVDIFFPSFLEIYLLYRKLDAHIFFLPYNTSALVGSCLCWTRLLYSNEKCSAVVFPRPPLHCLCASIRSPILR